MPEKISIGKERIENDETRPTISVTVNISIADDAPPSLTEAVMRAVGALVTVGLDEESCVEIRDHFMDIRARNQRKADNVARLLIGDDEPKEGTKP